MRIIFFEDRHHARLLPLIYTRPASQLRMGIFTMAERWNSAGFEVCGDITRPYLQALFPEGQQTDAVYVNGQVFPSAEVVAKIRSLSRDRSLWSDGRLIATYNRNFVFSQEKNGTDSEDLQGVVSIQSPADIFTLNGYALKMDYSMITQGKKSDQLDPSVTVIGDRKMVFLESGARVLASTLNTTDGPIYLDKDAEIMEGSHIRGPFSLGEHAQVKMGTRIYGPTTIGPHCKVGGEISNSVILGFSNKAHDGFLGNSVIGEWCNLGADTNTSNLKNNYGHVKTWHYDSESMEDTGLTFCGLTMGDHSKCGINTMFNTGTVAGVGANIFGGDFPPKQIPSFSWGGSEGFEEYDFDKMLATAQKVFGRRNIELSDIYVEMLREVFRLTARHRQDTTQSQE